MPNNPEHSEDSLKRYGKTFSELHAWMDEPSTLLAGHHRKYRHDPNTTPREAKAIFGENADHACLDHIRLDALGSRRRGISKNTNVISETRKQESTPFFVALSSLIFLLIGFYKIPDWTSIIWFFASFISFLFFIGLFTQSRQIGETRENSTTEKPAPINEPVNWGNTQKPLNMNNLTEKCSKCGANYFSAHEKCPYCLENYPRYKAP